MVIENPSVGSEAGRSLERLRLIAEVSAAARTDESTPARLQRICELIVDAMDADACLIRQLKGDVAELQAQRGLPPGTIPTNLRSDFEIPKRMIEDQCPVTVEDVRVDPRTSFSDGLPYISYAGAPMIADGEVIGLLGVYQVKDARRFSEEDLLHLQIIANHVAVLLVKEDLVGRLRVANAALDNRVEEHAQARRRTQEQLDSFAYSVAHDLRAPLRAISTRSALLIREFGHDLPHAAHQQLEMQSVAANQVAQHIDGILTLARLERAECERSEVDLAEMAHGVVAQLAAEDDRFDIAGSLADCVDPGLTRALLFHLFDNALKYGSTGSRFEISFGRDEQGYYVRDQGPGFDPAFAEKVFNPFERLVRDSQIPGVGTGLTVARKIAELHGGQITADPQPGMGTVIRFTLWPSG